jgi:hypothetical protein
MHRPANRKAHRSRRPDPAGTRTITDRAWTDELRRPRETRAAFIRRVLLGETDPVDAPEGETTAMGFEM